MKFLQKLNDAVQTAALRLSAWLTVQLVNEPVRIRAAFTSALVAAGVVVPALANANFAATIAGIGVTAVSVLMGESARAKVSPTDK